LRHGEVGDHANRRLPVFLSVHRLRRDAEAKTRRLLRVLFLRLGSLPAGPGRALGRDGRGLLRRRIAIMTSKIVRTSHDWLRSPRTSLFAWWIPWIAVIAGLFAPIPVRTTIWIIALSWMGTACILNAKRCGRTHCRYTGPFYLAMIAPVVALGFGFVSARIYAWLIFAGVILPGSGLLWWATERAWGKLSR
jgi:hypothetical protein